MSYFDLPDAPKDTANKAVWWPQVGPQSDAISATWCDEIMYGGARGGGKTDYLLGDWLQDVDKYEMAWQGIFFRKTYDDLKHAIRRSLQIYPQTGAIWRSTAKEWKWPNGACLRFAYLDNVRDANRYQGHEFCVEVSTPILMADGSAKRIDEIKVGDHVQTLLGSKPVTHTVKPYIAPCVKLKTERGEQTQPVWHPILTDSGWQSYASILGISSKGFESAYQGFEQLPCVNGFSRHLEHNQRLIHNPLQDDSSTLYHVSDISSKLFDASSRVVHQLALMIQKGQKLTRALYQQVLDRTLSHLIYGGVPYAQTDLGTASSFQESYLSYLHQYGGQPQFPLVSAEQHLPLQVYAALRTHIDRMLDESGSTQEHIPSSSSFSHPYIDKVCRSVYQSSYHAFSLSPLGYHSVCDLTVADANHYINADNGAISSNTWIAWDEIGQWDSDEGYKMLIACLRTAHDVPTKRIRATANPGGIGHHWVKERFVDINPAGFSPYDDPDTQMTRMFIPSSVTDNKILLEKDPQYINRLKGVGSPELVKAWLEGDWNIIKGAYFPEFSTADHVIPPRKLPSHWLRFRAFDWGSASPFACVWFAVSDGTLPGIPKECLVVYREWYGASGTNKGLNMKNELIARGILNRESNAETITYSVADPAMFKSDGGPSIAEVFYKEGVNFRRADNARIVGWSQLRSRLLGNSDGPGILFFNTCKDTIRSLPALQHDEKKPEDVNTVGDDHLADAIRYGCQSRPYVKMKVVPERSRHMHNMTMNELWNKQAELERKRGF